MICWGPSADHDLSHHSHDHHHNPIIMEQPLSFKCFVEQNLGRSALFFIYGFLEFVMIILLLIDGLLTLFSYEFAKFFDLKFPCFFCTRIDQALLHRNLNFYYNDTICEAHKRDISSLAYCHAHKKISDIKTMCESCLLSFASDKDSSDYFGEDDLKVPVKSVNVLGDYNKGNAQRCSCCMEFLGKGKFTRTASINAAAGAQPPPSSPRAWKNDELPNLNYTEVKLLPNNETEVPEVDQNVTNPGRDESRAMAVPMVAAAVAEDMAEDALKTPSYAKGNKFFGIPLSDTPRFSKRTRNMSIDFLSSSDVNMDGDDGGIVQHLKRQVLLERKSLMALCMELDEERNASAIAANNAMAMITRLQAEKAAVQMQASQYQRMMEEQAEYDREEKNIMKDMIMKREEEIEVLESEIDAYREKFGPINFGGSEFCEIEADEEFQSLKFRSLSSFGEMSCRSLNDVLDHHAVLPDEVYPDSDNERSHHSVVLRTIPETNTNTNVEDSPPSLELEPEPEGDESGS